MAAPRSLSPIPPAAVDPAPVLADLRALAAFGRVGRGVTRPSFSEVDMASRRWLAGLFGEAGLVATVDGVGNVMGSDRRARAALLTGSHSDSVPLGGWLDGAMGVIFALGAARAWRAFRPASPVGIDVVAFADEEGTYESMIGSRSLCGLWPGLPDKDTGGLAKALAAAGLSGRGEHRVDPARHRAYLEAHIEQGPVLEDEEVQVGVVQGIVGVRRFRIRFTGRADHAGTTPMKSRRDAGRAMFRFAAALDRDFARRAPKGAVWNIGIASLSPGAANVVPRAADLTVEFRHLDPAGLEAMSRLLQKEIEHSDVPVSVEPYGTLEPSHMDPALMDALREAAREVGATTRDMPSGAGHDAMIMATRLPAAMMFVPSIGGRSHDPAEDTAEADLERGFRVYATWAFRLLERMEQEMGEVA